MFTGPYWFFWIMSKLFGKLPMDMLRAMIGPVCFDTHRSIEELGLNYIPAAETANDMAKSLIDLGIVPAASK